MFEMQFLKTKQNKRIYFLMKLFMKWLFTDRSDRYIQTYFCERHILLHIVTFVSKQNKLCLRSHLKKKCTGRLGDFCSGNLWKFGHRVLVLNMFSMLSFKYNVT